MSGLCFDQRVRSRRCTAVWLVAAVLLSACSSSPTGSSDTALTSRFSNLFSSSDSNAQASAGSPTFNAEDCPVVDIRTGAGTMMVASRSAQPSTASDLRYQFSFSQLARQCSAVGSSLVMRVGVQGRIIVGPAGGSGQAEVPLRYAVVQEGPEPKTIVTKFKRIPVTIAPGESNVPFTDVEENLSFPIPPRSKLDAYVVYVGFDEIGDKNEQKPASKKAAPKRK
jgi:hypothetical protein